MNPCETEDIIADVFSNVMGDITTGYQNAITPLAAGSGTSTQGRLADVLSQENVLANLENGNLFGGLAAALGAGIGINASQSGAITSALAAGNYAAALTSLVDFSGSNAAVGGLSTAIQSIDNGDIVGAFQGLAGPLGIDSKLMGAVGASLGAITNGDIGSLTNAIGNLGGVAPQILTDVLGGRLPLSGIDIGGFGALGGLDFDLALATTFMSTAAAFLECDPKPECPIEDTYSFGSGGKSKEDSNEKVNTNNIVDKVTKEKENIVESNVSGAQFSPNGVPLNDAARRLLFPGGGGEVTDVGQFTDTGVPLDDTARNFLFPGGTGGVSDFNTSDFSRLGKLNLTPKNKFNVPKIDVENVDVSSYNIPQNAIVNQSNFIISESKAYEKLTGIETPITNDFDEIQDVNENNRLIYKQVYGGDGKDVITQDINGNDIIIRPGDSGYNEAYIQLQETIRRDLPLN